MNIPEDATIALVEWREADFDAGAYALAHGTRNGELEKKAEHWLNVLRAYADFMRGILSMTESEFLRWVTEFKEHNNLNGQ